MDLETGIILGCVLFSASIILIAAIGFAFPVWYNYSWSKEFQSLDASERQNEVGTSLNLPQYTRFGIYYPTNLSSQPFEFGKFLFIEGASVNFNTLKLVFQNCQVMLKTSSLGSFLPNLPTSETRKAEKGSISCSMDNGAIQQSSGMIIDWSASGLGSNQINLFSGMSTQFAFLRCSNLANGEFLKQTVDYSAFALETDYVNAKFTLHDQQIKFLYRLSLIRVNSSQNGAWADFVFERGGTIRVRFQAAF